MTKAQLEPGEVRLLRGARAGLTVAEQALGLRTTPAKIAYRRRKILRKLGARNMTEAVGIALERGLLGGPPRPIEKIAPRQRSAFYAKAGELDRLRQQPDRTTHDEALAAATDRCGRPIHSVNDLSYEEASDAIDWIAERIAGELSSQTSGATG